MNPHRLPLPDAERPWILDSACRRHPHPEWWDGSRDGERREAREERQKKAKAVCATCPATGKTGPCYSEAVPCEDEGVRAGQVLPPVQANGRRDLVPVEHAARKRAEIKHGDEAGYMKHYRRGERPVTCRPCLDGYTAARKERAARRKAS